MKKVIAGVLAVMMTAAAFAGCGASNTGSSATEAQSSGTASNGAVDASMFGEEDNIKLKVWGPDKSVDLLKQQCDAFIALYPEKKITIDVVAQGENDAGTQLLNDASTAADVFGIPSDQINKLVNAKVLQEVAFADDVKANNSQGCVEAATIDGTLYAYPETADNGYYLVYDKSVIKEGDEAKFETILEDCKTAGKKFIMSAGDGFYACMFAFTGGCKTDGLEADGATQKFTDYKEDEVIATMQAFSKLFHDYSGTFQSLEVSNISSGFASGTCGAGIDGTWDATANESALGDNYGAAKLPTINVNGEDKQIISMFGYKYIGVNAASKFPRTAQILANYLTGEECQTQRADKLGWGPSNTKVAESDTVKNSATITAILAQAENSVPQADLADQFWDPMGNLGNQLIAEKTDPSDAAYMKQLLKDTLSNIQDV
ncbi:MAG: extracellular solute-binding protein [Oscillospiraceae bacterium]|nr:extracellular solute-binding protein [Oscillospiraceae bacterium]